MISPRGGVRFEASDHVYVITTGDGELRMPDAFRARSVHPRESREGVASESVASDDG